MYLVSALMEFLGSSSDCLVFLFVHISHKLRFPRLCVFAVLSHLVVHYVELGGEEIVVEYAGEGNIIFGTEVRPFLKVFKYRRLKRLELAQLTAYYRMIVKEVNIASEGGVKTVGGSKQCQRHLVLFVEAVKHGSGV